jgi:hypothetical protein
MHQGYGMRAWIGDGNFRGFRWTKNNSFLSIWEAKWRRCRSEEAPSGHVIESVSERFPGLPNLPFR